MIAPCSIRFIYVFRYGREMAIDPRALRTYLAVCRTGSITGAARALNISQPAVSVTVAQLEQSLRTKLFERSRTGVILTPAGEALFRRAEALEDLLRIAEEEVALAEQAISGPFRIGGTPGALTSIVPELVSGLTTKGVRHRMYIIEGTDAALTSMLQNGELDVAVVTTQMDTLAPDLEEMTIISDPFSLIVGRSNHKLPDEIHLSSTADMRWIMPAAAGAFRRQINALFLAADTPLPSQVIRCDSLLTTKAIVRTSDYVTILPNGVAAAELESGALRAIAIVGATINRKIGVRYMKSGPRTATVEALVQCLHVRRGGPTGQVHTPIP